MACVIAAPKSGSGKTILSLLITSWAFSQNKKIQTFKIGPDYLDPQHLSAVSKIACRNLDTVLCGEKWVKESFHYYGSKADFSLIEGVMGLFDGIGSSMTGSTAEIAKLLGLPVILIIDARGQARSLAALIKGFKELDQEINIAGVVLNKIKSTRHKELLEEVLNQLGVRLFGTIPERYDLNIPSKNLGLAPSNEIKNLSEKIEFWSTIAKENLDIKNLGYLLTPPKNSVSCTNKVIKQEKKFNYSIAIVEDNAFHFKYHETKESLEALGIKVLNWNLIEDKPIPKEAKGLIIPGGFPENYAEEISNAKRSLKSIKSFFGKYPVYAECGGMLILGESLYDINNNEYRMTGLLPFKAKEGNLKIGYRRLRSLHNSLILSKKDFLTGHEFHRWEVQLSNKKNTLKSPWEINGYNINTSKEGWCNNLFHASWIHLHWPSSPNILNKWTHAVKSSIENNN